MGSVILLVAIETKVARQSREGLMVNRKEELDDLIAAFGRGVHEEHPNPERSGCPGLSALTMLANGSVPLPTGPILDHIRKCAICLCELRKLRRARKPSQ
jgi:hypothetical protein